MLDLPSLGSIPRRIAALVIFAGPALALWVSIPAFDGKTGESGALAEMPGLPSFDDFARDGRLVGEVAARYEIVLVPKDQPERSAEQLRQLYGLHAFEAYVVDMDMAADARWSEGARFQAIRLKLGVMKNLLFGFVWQALGGPRDCLLHAGVGTVFLLSGFWLFRLTRHA